MAPGVAGKRTGEKSGPDWKINKAQKIAGKKTPIESFSKKAY